MYSTVGYTLQYVFEKLNFIEQPHSILLKFIICYYED